MAISQNQLAVINDYRSRLPVDVVGMIEALGVDYEGSFDLDSDISGEIERLNESKFVIRVNATHADTRQRFTAAHELGHYMLHRSLIGEGLDDNKAYRSQAVGKFHNTNITARHETEANQFAAAVLMPTGLVVLEHAKNSDIGHLASRFGVSHEAMRIRTKSLNL
ncbi:ImmA/IrrE family metallo-endopeptidase [Microbulbifer magnicolonia]|uniref:ImmA/IrrE family metallo-endopeptidase n=1 Tax=Microbulbifer magnicolonia TaxID=3109744 RepID=UPI002B413F37|nr:ImmA/IrrE family metallo-endopeptidase [Microbulbifer sp. GG15]